MRSVDGTEFFSLGSKLETKAPAGFEPANQTRSAGRLLDHSSNPFLCYNKKRPFFRV